MGAVHDSVDIAKHPLNEQEGPVPPMIPINSCASQDGSVMGRILALKMSGLPFEYEYYGVYLLSMNEW